MPLELVTLRCRTDNYAYLLHGADGTVLIDAPEATPVLRELAARDRSLSAILLTHHHGDHVDGVAEIVEATRRMLVEGVNPETLDETRFAGFLYTAGQPDPDLLIRTSGEMRVSNFLLWQIAYAEIWVTETLWPDFRARHLLEGILEYQKRDRRYGGIKQPVGAGR